MKPGINIFYLSENTYKVVVKDDVETTHYVSIDDTDHERFTKKKETKRNLVMFAFKFLLEREKNTSILPKFVVSIICDFFPEFEKEALHWAGK